ncbi:hypothetical protein LZ30DRAFT_707124 [Colletotrichum cereale]|nr:hypothetical protein LZ30DRAFT_707124 [Colletotrichum cereale]
MCWSGSLWIDPYGPCLSSFVSVFFFSLFLEGLSFTQYENEVAKKRRGEERVRRGCKEGERGGDGMMIVFSTGGVPMYAL